jgi:glycosyltransferase involved in cell wall biosynthesis
MQPIADNLVVVMPRGMGIAKWKRVGLLERDWCLYDRVGPMFRRVTLVLNGEGDDGSVEAEPAQRAGGRFDLRLQRIGSGEAEEGAAVERVARDLLPGSTIVRTEQLTVGGIAIEIRDRARAKGHVAALITRGGFLWSRFAALEFGPASPQARMAKVAERRLCLSADLLVGTTEEMVRDLCWRYCIDLGRTAVVPNFVVPCENILTASEREPGLIITAGELVARKRIDILIEAVAALDEELRSRVTLEVVGDGPELANLQRIAASLSAPVRFVPPMGYAALRERMARCLIYAQASELEGHPRSVIDAMAAGAVAVVADSPGLGSLVRTGSTGVLVPTSGPSDFANAFTGLLSDTDWCDLLGGTAARTSAMYFGIDQVAKLEAEAYRRALASVHARRSAA